MGLISLICNMCCHNYPSVSVIKNSVCTVQPRLSELRAKHKVQVKVQISGTISICTCAIECSAAIICYARANDRSAKVVSELLFSAKMG